MFEFVVGVTGPGGDRRGTGAGTTETVEEAMKYLLMICRDEAVELSPEEQADEDSSTQAWVEEMDGRGVRRFGQGLRPVSDATTVRVRGGDVLVAETKEQIAGFDVIECGDLDEAIEVAAKHPVAKYGGTIEVRPFWTD